MFTITITTLTLLHLPSIIIKWNKPMFPDRLLLKSIIITTEATLEDIKPLLEETIIILPNLNLVDTILDLLQLTKDLFKLPQELMDIITLTGDRALLLLTISRSFTLGLDPPPMEEVGQLMTI